MQPEARLLTRRNLVANTRPPYRPNARVGTLNLDEWMCVLKLINLWTLDSLRKKSVEESEKLFQEKSCIDKVLLGKKYNISKWLVEGYEELGRREKMVDDHERAMLGADSFASVVKLRERFLAHIVSKYDEAYTAGRYEEGDIEDYTVDTLKKKFDFRAAVKDVCRSELIKDKDYIP